MSGGIMSQVSDPDGCDKCAVHIAVDTNDTAENLTTGSVKGARKLDVVSYDEVYYPAVSIIRNSSVQPVEESTIQSEVIEKSVGPRKTSRILRRLWSRLGTVVVAGIAVCALALVIMRFSGFRTFTVMSGSMTPDYPVGALIYVRPVDYRSLQVGDVISFIANDDNTVVTHRIVEIETDPKDAGVLRFKTKGDANEAADARLVHYKNVLGTPFITLPFIGYFAHNIQQPPGVYIALVVGTLLLAWTFLPGTLEERRKTARNSIG